MAAPLSTPMSTMEWPAYSTEICLPMATTRWAICSLEMSTSMIADGGKVSSAADLLVGATVELLGIEQRVARTAGRWKVRGGARTIYFRGNEAYVPLFEYWPLASGHVWPAVVAPRR